MTRNHYEVLGVSDQAEPAVIKAAYQALAKRYHPDGESPDEERMKCINGAWEVLRSEESRARHDAELAADAEPADPTLGHDGWGEETEDPPSPPPFHSKPPPDAPPWPPNGGGPPPNGGPPPFGWPPYGAPRYGPPPFTSTSGPAGPFAAPFGGRPHPDGTLVLVFGILGLVLCGALGPVAWWKGNVVLQEIDQNPAAYSNRGSIQVGRCLGIVASCLLMLTVGAIVLGACASLVDGVT